MTYSNYDHNCIITETFKCHNILSINDLIIWNKVIKNDKVIFDASLLNIRNSSIQNHKNNNIYFDKIIE